MRENGASNQDASFSASIPRLIAMMAEIFWFPLMQDSLIRHSWSQGSGIMRWSGDLNVVSFAAPVLYKSAICNTAMPSSAPVPSLLSPWTAFWLLSLLQAFISRGCLSGSRDLISEWDTNLKLSLDIDRFLNWILSMFNDIKSIVPVTNIAWSIHPDDGKLFSGPYKNKCIYARQKNCNSGRLFLSYGGISWKKEDCWITKSLHYITGHQKYFTTENYFNWD